MTPLSDGGTDLPSTVTRAFLAKLAEQGIDPEVMARLYAALTSHTKPTKHVLDAALFKQPAQ